MESDQKQEALKRLAHWYRQSSVGKAPQSREQLDSIVTKRAELYRCRAHERLRVLILVTPSAVEDRILEEEKVAQAVQISKIGRSGGP